MDDRIRRRINQAILDNLETRFEVVPESITREILEIHEPAVLRSLHRSSIKVASLKEFKTLLKKART